MAQTMVLVRSTMEKYCWFILSWVVCKYRGSASTRESHQGRSRGSRVTWSKLGTLMENPLYFHGNQACYHGNRHRYHGYLGMNGNHGWTQDGGIQDGGKFWNFENFFPNFFIKANFEILTTDLDTRPKSSVLTIESLRGPGCSVTELLGF